MQNIFGKLKPKPGAEQRKYVRIDTVLPVQFRLKSPDKKDFLSAWVQGFTSNISRGGLYLAVNNLKSEDYAVIQGKKAKACLEISAPFSGKPVNALASVAWSKSNPAVCEQYFIGLTYEEIDPRQNNMLMRYAWGRNLFLPIVVSLIIILGLALGGNAYLNLRLAKRNKNLTEEMTGVLVRSRKIKSEISRNARERQSLAAKMQALESRMALMKQEQAVSKATSQEGNKKFNELIVKLAQEKNALQEKSSLLWRREGMMSKEVTDLDKKREAMEKENAQKMYSWLKVHQNPRTGLTASFEGDQDVANWAFIYDQSLLVEAYANFSDFSRAKKILDFFANQAKREKGWFFNAYYADEGSPAEFVKHSGPNIWLGIAIVQYARKSGDNSYLSLAEEIANNIIDLQNQDGEGGVRGGPDLQWYSTEHNLDAYAFLNMLSEITGKAEYKEAADKVLNWLTSHTYGRQELPVKRGKGDSTIATDTYAWSIAALGPEKLEELHMDADKILDFAEKNCAVEVIFNRPDGERVRIKGFDFAPSRNLARGGIVSSEWTAQMIVSYKIMAEYYLKKGKPEKARFYSEKADNYLAQLARMIVSSPSASGQGEGCLPYATQDNVDTGHGWMTPKGSSTGSLSGTAYVLFAYYGFNPLKLKE